MLRRVYQTLQQCTWNCGGSGYQLSDTQMEALKAKLEKLSGKKVYLVQKTDASVLGGLRVELEGVQLDGTVQSRISGISKKLNELVV